MSHPNRPTGLGLWIAFPTMLEGGWDAIAARAYELGADWLAVRTTDKTLEAPALEAAIRATHMAGLRWYGWHYSYPAADRVATQVAHMQRCFDSAADGHIVNAEIEFSGKRAEAKRLGEAIRKAMPDQYIAHAPLGWIDFHGPWPFEEFFEWTDDVHPQMYWTELRYGKYDAGFASQLARWRAGFRHGGVQPGEPWTLANGKRVCPIGVTYGKGDVQTKQQPPGSFNVADLERFLHRDANTYECVSLYSFEVARPEALAWLREHWGRR